WKLRAAWSPTGRAMRARKAATSSLAGIDPCTTPSWNCLAHPQSESTRDCRGGDPVATSETASLWENPLGTDGFEFIEYAAPDPVALGRLFEQMGFVAIATHRAKDVLLYRQGGVNFIVNAERGSFAQSFAHVHGPSICAIALRVKD